MPKDRKQYFIELDGALYSHSGSRLQWLADTKKRVGDKWYITDMQESVSMTMTVETEPRYAELMVARKLRESGEFDEPVSIITFWKKKHGKNIVDIFFSAVPTRIFTQYMDRLKANDDHALFFPIYSVIFHNIKRINPKEPVAMVFRHSRFADLVIGTKNRVYYANRCVAFDTSREQTDFLWNTVINDITAVEGDYRIKVEKVYLHNWIDACDPNEVPKEVGKKIYPLSMEKIKFSENLYEISFLKAIRAESGFYAITPFVEKTFYYAKKSLPYLNTIFFLASIFFVAVYFWCTHMADLKEKEYHKIKKESAEINRKISSLIPAAEYQETILFLKKLSLCKDRPSYKSIINDMSGAISPQMNVQVFKIDYGKDKIKIELFGKIETPFNRASNEYKFFLKALQKKGYSILENRFNTKIKTSDFLVKIQYKDVAF